MPTLTLSGFGSLPAISFNGSELWTTPNIGSANASTNSLVYLSDGSSSFARVIDFPTGFDVIANWALTANDLSFYNGTRFNLTAADNAAHAVNFLLDSVAGVAAYVDGTNSVFSGAVSSFSSPANIGGVSSQNLSGKMAEYGVWFSDKTVNNSAMNSNQHTYWGF
jgi:hypothetical protein